MSYLYTGAVFFDFGFIVSGVDGGFGMREAAAALRTFAFVAAVQVRGVSHNKFPPCEITIIVELENNFLIHPVDLRLQAHSLFHQNIP